MYLPETVGLVLFWGAAACVAYVYLGYPLLMGLLARRRRRCAPQAPPQDAPSVSVIIAAHNEEKAIRRRVQEFVGALGASGLRGEVIVVSDGSSDATAACARSVGGGRVRVIELPARAGKAVALTEATAAARYDVLVFADARQSWAPDSLKLLVENFADPQIGAVSGDLVVESAPGVMAGVGQYWRFEKWLRRQESQAHSLAGVTGAICAVRRELFRPIPPGTLLDDVYWPLCVAMQGYRVVHDPRALAFDRLPDRPADEFRRKVRTLSGNFQLLTLLPSALLPWRNPLWLQLVSHKVLRLLVPWLLLVMLLASASLRSLPYQLACGAQVLFYGVAVGGIVNRSLVMRLRLVGLAASFLLLNAAAWLAFWVWACGRAGQSWRKVQYDPALLSAARTAGVGPPAAAPPRGPAGEGDEVLAAPA